MSQYEKKKYPSEKVPSNICSMSDCTNRVVARSLCPKHWMRWRTHGDPNFVKQGHKPRIRNHKSYVMGDIGYVELLHGNFAKVDANVFHKVIAFRWFEVKGHRTTYARGVLSIGRGGNGRNTSMHRFIVEDKCDGMEIDHINHDGLDNRMANLRVVSRAQNMQNQVRHDVKKTSKYKGVSFDPSKGWVVTCKGKRIGSCETEYEAALLYNQAAGKEFGNYAYLNSLPNSI